MYAGCGVGVLLVEGRVVVVCEVALLIQHRVLLATRRSCMPDQPFQVLCT
jgi:hypothetical protein